MKLLGAYFLTKIGHIEQTGRRLRRAVYSSFQDSSGEYTVFATSSIHARFPRGRRNELLFLIIYGKFPTEIAGQMKHMGAK
jgi:hypothetical protein